MLCLDVHMVKLFVIFMLGGLSGLTPNPVVGSQVMALEHKELPFAAVQFHPESILTNPKTGLTILANCLRYLRYEEGGE